MGSDMMNYHQDPTKSHKAAVILRHIYEQRGVECPDWVNNLADRPYHNDVRTITLLENVLSDMSDEEQTMLLDARTEGGRELGIWLSELDKEQEKIALEQERAVARQVAIDLVRIVLTTEQIELLGIESFLK